jgi:hypothetical protein
MERKRKVYAPFSLTSEAGVTQTPVEGYIDVNQVIYPTVNTGTVNENGKWAGVKSDDEVFIGLSKAEAIGGAGGNVLFPDTNNHPSINMAGFATLQFAIKPTVAGAYGIEAVFGPDTIRYAGLEPIRAGATIQIIDSTGSSDESIFNDTVSLGNDEWNVFTVLADRCKGQENMQVKVFNNTGSLANIEFAFRRLV